MSSTNQTTNYHLSQYIGTDKPTYLGDYNGDMLKIDNAIKGNADDIATNSSNITTVSTTATSALNKANANETAIETVSGTATSALSKANANEAKITALELNTNIVTSETKIGTFKGKDLYRTIIEYTQAQATSGSGLVQIDVPTNISTVKRVVSMYGSFDSQQDGTYNANLPNFTATGTGSLSINALLIYENQNAVLRMRAYNHAITANTEFEFVIEYTKD